MIEWAIIDFSGYYYKSKFIIKEICALKSQGNNISVWRGVTLPPEPIPSYQNVTSYLDFREKCGIEWEFGNCSIDELSYELAVLFTNSRYVFISNEEKFGQIKNFFDVNIIRNVFISENFGFREKLGVLRECHFHVSQTRPYYCAEYNAQKILDWKSKFMKISNIVIDFNGYYSDEKFNMKEISIFGVDREGSTLQHNLFVIKYPRDLLNEKIDEYNKNYYEKYGIEWVVGSHELSRFIAIIKNIYECTLNNKRIFVKSAFHRNQLQRSFNLSRKFVDLSICMDKLKYNGDNFDIEVSRCHFHNSHLNSCADFEAQKMAQWIVKMKYYDDQIINAKIAFDVLRYRELNANYTW